MPQLRLDRILSDLGVLSRSEVRACVRAGRITIDGRCARTADEKLDPTQSVIALDGRPLSYSAHCCYMLNKPAGVLSATEDPGAATVLDLLEDRLVRRGLFPVGRLDKDTEGLLLLTDDGALAHRVCAPRSGVVKRYMACVDAEPEPNAETRFARGLQLPDGLHCRPARLERLGERRVQVWLSEGKFHQVKRMLAAVGSQVTYLRRTAIGALELDAKLPPGGYKLLKDEEIVLIFEPLGELL